MEKTNYKDSELLYLFLSCLVKFCFFVFFFAITFCGETKLCIWNEITSLSPCVYLIAKPDLT